MRLKTLERRPGTGRRGEDMEQWDFITLECAAPTPTVKGKSGTEHKKARVERGSQTRVHVLTALSLCRWSS